MSRIRPYFLLAPLFLVPVASCQSAGSSHFCDLARQDGAANLALVDDEQTPEQFRQVLAHLDALVTAAPSEIHDDLAAVDTFEHQTFDADGNATAGTGRPDPHLHVVRH